MKKIVVTGSSGFIGKNLLAVIRTRKDIGLATFDVDDDPSILYQLLSGADVIFHLAGVNRPKNVEEFEKGNTGLTGDIISFLEKHGLTPRIIFTSSIQATLDNPYGISKKHAEDTLRNFANNNHASVLIYRLPNVYGKWCRPNYNSVVATFCYNVAHNLPLAISDPSRELELVYIDDIVKSFINELDGNLTSGVHERTISNIYKTSLAELAETINSFRHMRQSLLLPAVNDRFVKSLYSTYLSYLEADNFSYALTERKDDRGMLAELYKSPFFGQTFVSRTKPGITRGNHYHHLKTEKFCVIEGEAIIRFRMITNKEVISYPVNGKELKIVDIPPGYTHSIENIGQTELITLFWANEQFNPDEPDTYFESVL